MNKIQQKYSAFMESVCTQFNCKQALPALKQGFKAFCEAVDVDYDPFDIDNMVANASDAEFGAENNDERYNVGRYTGQGSEEFAEGDADDINSKQVINSLAKRIQKLLDQDPNPKYKFQLEFSEDGETLHFHVTTPFDRWHFAGHIGLVYVYANKIIFVYPGRTDSGTNIGFDYIENRPTTIEFNFNDEQIAEKIVQILKNTAIGYVNGTNRRFHRADPNLVNDRVIHGSAKNDTDFISAMRSGDL